MTTWRHWAFSLGLVCVMVMLSTLVTRHFFPYIAFAFAALLAVMIYNRRNRRNQGLAIPYIVTVSLLIEGFLLTGFNLTVRITDIYELAGTPVNDELPFIVQLSMSPVISLVSGVFMLRRLGRGRFFRTRAGRSDVSLVQRMVWQETRYQTRLLFLISLGMSVAEWIYTYFVFTSVSINKPDMFFFVWMPVIVYALSLVYLGFRCISLWAFYSQNDPVMMLNPHRSSIVRFLIVSDDTLYLSRHQLDVKQGMEPYYDTPVRLRAPYTDKFSDTDAMSLFKKYTGIDAGIEVVKFLFDGLGHGLDNSFFHYLCVLASPADVKGSRITISREQVRSISSISDEMKVMLAPFSGRCKGLPHRRGPVDVARRDQATRLRSPSVGRAVGRARAHLHGGYGLEKLRYRRQPPLFDKELSSHLPVVRHKEMECRLHRFALA